MLGERIEFVRPVLPRMEDMEQDLRSVLASRIVTKGAFLAAFEEQIATHLGVRHAIGVSSCTSGLMLVFKCLNLSGEVLVPSFTFMATVSSVVWAGARPVFVDVDPNTGNLDPDAVEAAISPRTSAILAAHIFGNPADMEALEDIAHRHGLKLVFDAAHAFGTLHRGRPVGPQGDAQVFSLSPTKLLIAGEGGIVATDDDELAQMLRLGREYGNNGNYDSAVVGMNARMCEGNAVMALKSLAMLESAARRRSELAHLYRSRLCRLPGLRFQSVRPVDQSSYKDFSVMVDPALSGGVTRDGLAEGLASHEIDTRAYYHPPVHRHAVYRHFHGGRPLCNTDALAQQSLSLPMWSEMDDAVVERICNVIESLWR